MLFVLIGPIKNIKHIGLIIVLIALSGCDTTGGNIGGLFPAPKLLKGEMNNSTYIARDNLFSISSPHKDDTYEYTYLEIKELYKNNNAYVSFGPAAFNGSIYRVEVTAHPINTAIQVNVKDMEQQVIGNYIKQLEDSYGTEPELIESHKIKINGFDAHYRKMSQKVPAGLYMSNSIAILEHYTYLIDYEIGVALIWVEIPIDPPTRGNALSPIDFAKSLKILPNKSLNQTGANDAPPG